MKIITLCESSDFVSNLRQCLADILRYVQIMHARDFDAARELLKSQGGVNLVLVSMDMIEGKESYGFVDELHACTQAPVLLVAATESQDAIRESVISGSECYISESPAGRALLRAMVSGMVKRISESDETSQAPSEPEKNEKRADVSTRLTPRQIEVLVLIKQGKSNKQIARDLKLAEGTVKIHCLAIFRELNVRNRTQAAMVADDFLAPVSDIVHKADSDASSITSRKQNTFI